MSRPRTRAGTALAVVAALTLVLALASPAQAVTLIKGYNSRWHPAKVRITRGSVVRWKAVDVRHRLRSYGGNWSLNAVLDPGESVRHRFRRTGTFKFYCSIHGYLLGGVCYGMCGKVTVTAG